MELKGKTALIAGASRPLGRAIARMLANLGANLVLPTFDWPESCREMEEEFTASNFTFISRPVDLRSREQIEQLIGECRQRFGGLDILINNIERGGMPVVHGSYDLPHNAGQWELELATTLTAKWLLYHHSRELLMQGEGGNVVNISSVAAITGRSGPASLLFSDGYSAANRAISSFTETWARETAPKVRVNELMLGPIRGRHAEDTRGWQALSAQERQAITDHTLLGRSGTAEEVATAVRFLIMDATFMTGAILRLDGGFILGGERVGDLPEGILHQD